MNLNKSPESSIQSLSRALGLLELVIRNPVEQSVSELALQSGLHISTVSRLLSTMHSHGFLTKNPDTDKYIGGYKILELSALIAKKHKLREVAYPFLYKLMDDSGETVNLAILDDFKVVFIESVENSSLVTASSRLGKRMPLHCTAAGKVFLALTNDLSKIIDKLELISFTTKTVISLEDLTSNLEQIRAKGYAFDDEEQEIGLRCVAAPIRNHFGKVCAAVSISGPTVRLTGDKINDVIPMVISTANEISQQLGYSSI